MALNNIEKLIGGIILTSPFWMQNIENPKIYDALTGTLVALTLGITCNQFYSEFKDDLKYLHNYKKITKNK